MSAGFTELRSVISDNGCSRPRWTELDASEHLKDELDRIRLIR
jgi:hypothetical protein